MQKITQTHCQSEPKQLGQSPFLVSGFSGSVELVKYLISIGSDVLDCDNNGRTILHYACCNGKIELVQFLVDNYPDTLSIRDKSGQSAFLFAGFSGSVDLVKYLISRGCVVNDKSETGRTVLHHACVKGKLELAQYLLDNYSDMLARRDNLGQSPFLVTGFSGSVELVRYLISQGCDEYDKDSDGYTVLHNACQEGNIELVKYLVDSFPYMATIKDKTGQSPFLVAGFSGSVELVKYLITWGCDVWDKDINGCTVLRKACSKGKMAVVQYLVENYKNMLKIKDNEGISPFLASGFSGSVKLVVYLISQGCEVSDKDNSGCTILLIACMKGNFELVQYLLNKYPDLSKVRDNVGQSPFLFSALSGSLELVEYFISREYDVQDMNRNGRTVFHHACQVGNLELAQYFAENYADLLEVRDKTGGSPFLVAGFSGSVDLVKYLISRGCDVKDTDSDGWNILHFACNKGKLELVQYLVESYPDMLIVRDKTGKTPFLVAGVSGSVDLVKYLISKKCDLLDKDINGWTILHYAWYGKKEQFIKYMVTNYPEWMALYERTKT